MSPASILWRVNPVLSFNQSEGLFQGLNSDGFYQMGHKTDGSAAGNVFLHAVAGKCDALQAKARTEFIHEVVAIAIRKPDIRDQ